MANSTEELRTCYENLAPAEKLDLIGELDRRIADRKEFFGTFSNAETAVLNVARYPTALDGFERLVQRADDDLRARVYRLVRDRWKKAFACVRTLRDAGRLDVVVNALLNRLVDCPNRTGSDLAVIDALRTGSWLSEFK
ncbi:hypothetical protein ACFL2H_00430 [Planctomycetota bacterium]